MNRFSHRLMPAVSLAPAIIVGACAAPRAIMPPADHPSVAPAAQACPGPGLQLDATQVRPMFTELLPIDLPTVIKVSGANNLDIQIAREVVQASRGQLESTVGSLFPALVPTALFEHVEGTVRTAEGKLIGAGFNTFQPSLALEWIINPGRVAYEIVAAKKRLLASHQQEEATFLETIRRSAVQYYDLVLAQARITTANQGVTQAEELLRTTEVRLRAGTGVKADQLRAQARLAERRQELLEALNSFYQNSIALTLTLHLDSSVTLVPNAEEVSPVQLVREDMDIDELLGLCVQFRPDLERLRTLIGAVTADKGAAWWGAFGPQFQASYQYGGITGHAENVVPSEGIPNNLIVNPLSTNGTFSTVPLANGAIKEGILRGSKQWAGQDDQTYGFHDQQRATAALAWRISVSAFGQLKAASAAERQAIIEAERKLDFVRAEVVSSLQSSATNRQLIATAQEQVAAAQEALRLTQANFRIGTMTTLDVLQADDALTSANLRFASAVVRFNQSQINLLAALGLLTESSITRDPNSIPANNGIR